jgi:hypothetical protein
MPSARRGEPAAGVRKGIVLVLALVAWFVPYLNTFTGLGQSIGAFAADGDTVIRAADYAFTIWALLFAGLIVYGVFQALPRGLDPALIRRFGWPSALALAGISGWSLAAQFDVEWATPPLIIVSALVLIVPLLGAGRDLETASTPQRLMVAWPLSALAGWLTVASPINLIGVLESQEMLGALPDVAWALLGVLVVTGLAILVTARTRLWTFSAPVVWGLAAVVVAEWQRNQPLAWLAGAMAVLIAAVTLLFVRARRR